jgi:hypothetical protein
MVEMVFALLLLTGPQNYRTSLSRVPIKMSQGQALCYEGQKHYR